MLTALLLGSPGAGAAFTDKEAREIFSILDPDHHGTVDRLQFEINKMHAFYDRFTPSSTGEMRPLTFEQTRLSRAFFDKIDQNHKGYLDGVDINDGIRFEDIDTARRGYFDFSDFVIFLNKIGR